MSKKQTVMKIVLSVLVSSAGWAFANERSFSLYGRCETLLQKQHEKIISPRQLIRIADWLNQNVSQINIHSTHLEALVPLALSLKEAMKHSEPQTLLDVVAAEIDHRIQDRNLTYEYLFYLPFRVGFLINLQDGMIPGVFDSTYPGHYLTHAAFCAFLEENRIRKTKLKSMILTSLYDDLRKFPKAKFLLYPAELKYEDLNQLMLRDVWPIGIPMKPVEADGVMYSPLNFAYHDLVHWTVFYETPFKPHQLEISPTKLKEIEPLLLKAIDKQVVSHQDLRILHYIHFHLFHETSRGEFKFRVGENLMFPSVYSYAGGIKHVLEILKYTLTTDSELSRKYIRDDFHKLLTETNETPVSVAEKNITLYMKLVDDAALKVQF